MATYVPDATDKTQPTDDKKASSMGLEFRTLKAYIQDVVVGSLIAGKATNTGVGASGTWGINITGTAGSATTAGNATTAGTAVNVSGNGSLDGNSIYIHAPVPGQGAVQMRYGNALNSGYMEFLNAASTRIGYMGFGDGARINMVIENGAIWSSNVAIEAPSFIGNLNGTVAWTNVVGRPSLLSQFINDIGVGGGGGGGGTIVSFQGRADAAAVLTGTDVTGALGYTPYNASNPSAFVNLSQIASAGFQTSSGSVATAGSANTAVNLNGGTINATTIQASGLAKFNGGGDGFGRITTSTADPSGGYDGDIWLKV